MSFEDVHSDIIHRYRRCAIENCKILTTLLIKLWINLREKAPRGQWVIGRMASSPPHLGAERLFGTPAQQQDQFMMYSDMNFASEKKDARQQTLKVRAHPSTSLTVSLLVRISHSHFLQTRKAYTVTKPRERWTDEEHNKFLEALKLYGRQWRKIEGAQRDCACAAPAKQFQQIFVQRFCGDLGFNLVFIGGYHRARLFL